MLNIPNPRYWVYRIDQNRIKFFWKELKEERLRQGWGYNLGQDLRILSVDEGASRNKRMLEVSRGDILLVPQLPTWDKVAIVQAKTDWKEGYRFEISKELKDYGHIFPAQHLKSFRRASSPVSGAIRSTLRTPMRFWNIDRLADDVETVRAATEKELGSYQSVTKRGNEIIKGAFYSAFDKQNFEKSLVDKFNEKFSDKDWEEILFKVFENRYPSAQVEKVGSQKEKLHGTDILIKIPSPSDEKQYAIAVQIKDWDGNISIENFVSQINKAEYWQQEEGFQLIDKIVVFTQAGEKENKHLLEDEQIIKSNISLVFEEHLGVLLAKYGRTVIDLESDD